MLWAFNTDFDVDSSMRFKLMQLISRYILPAP